MQKSNLLQVIIQWQLVKLFAFPNNWYASLANGLNACNIYTYETIVGIWNTI